MIKLFSLFLISVILNGCVSAGYISTKTISFEPDIDTSKLQMLPKDKLSIDRFCLSKERGYIDSCNQENEHIAKMEEVIAFWGNPDSRLTLLNQEHFIYERDISWRGLFANILILPIPLMIPTGHNETILVFEENKIIMVKSERGNYNHALCGFHSTGPNGIGCYTKSQ
jgi:hypothetical protein